MADCINKEGTQGEKQAKAPGETEEANPFNMLVCMKTSESLKAVKHITSGAFHASALTRDGTLLNWGMGKLGRLGFGNELDQVWPRSIPKSNLVISAATW